MLKGYKTKNGYVTIAEQKKRIAKIKKENEETRKKREQEQEKEMQYITSLYYAEKREQEKLQKEQENYSLQCKNFIEWASMNFKNYNEYLIAWDIANRNIYQIEADLYKNKVTIEQVKKVYTIALNHLDKLQEKIYINYLFEKYV